MRTENEFDDCDDEDNDNWEDIPSEMDELKSTSTMRNNNNNIDNSHDDTNTSSSSSSSSNSSKQQQQQYQERWNSVLLSHAIYYKDPNEYMSKQSYTTIDNVIIPAQQEQQQQGEGTKYNNDDNTTSTNIEAEEKEQQEQEEDSLRYGIATDTLNNTLYVVIRGSVNVMNWTHNICTPQLSSSELGYEIGNVIHAGFLAYAERLPYDHIIKQAKTGGTNSTGSTPSGHSRPCRIVFCGHSLGGAIASVGTTILKRKCEKKALSLYDDENEKKKKKTKNSSSCNSDDNGVSWMVLSKNICSYTFGAPLFGSPSLERRIMNIHHSYEHYVDPNDIVPKLLSCNGVVRNIANQLFKDVSIVRGLFNVGLPQYTPIGTFYDSSNTMQFQPIHINSVKRWATPDKLVKCNIRSHDITNYVSTMKKRVSGILLELKQQQTQTQKQKMKSDNNKNNNSMTSHVSRGGGGLDNVSDTFTTTPAPSSSSSSSASSSSSSPNHHLRTAANVGITIARFALAAAVQHHSSSSSSSSSKNNNKNNSTNGGGEK